MKVVVVNKHRADALGGSELQCDIIARNLTALGHDVVYAALDARKAEYQASYRIAPFKSFGFLKALLFLRREKPDVVYWRRNKRGLFAAAVATKLAGAKFVYSMSHITDSQVLRFSGLVKIRRPQNLGVRALYLFAADLLAPVFSALNYSAIPLFTDGVVSNNGDYLKNVPVKHKVAIHNSMEIETVPFQWPRPFVIWVANIKTRKRPEDFFRLSKDLSESGVDFLMVGALQDQIYVAQLAEWSRERNFHYLGAKTLAEVNGMIAASLFLANTCEPEGFPNNCIQAWLLGKPVISLRFDPEGLLAEKGLGRHSGNFAQFLADVGKFISDEKLRFEVGRQAGAYAVQEFSAEHNIPTLVRFLSALVDQNNSAPAVTKVGDRP